MWKPESRRPALCPTGVHATTVDEWRLGPPRSVYHPEIARQGQLWIFLRGFFPARKKKKKEKKKFPKKEELRGETRAEGPRVRAIWKSICVDFGDP